MDVLKEPVGRRFRSGLGEEEVILRSEVVVRVSFGLSQGSRQPIGILFRCEFEPRSTTQGTGVNLKSSVCFSVYPPSVMMSYDLNTALPLSLTFDDGVVGAEHVSMVATTSS